MKLNSKAPRRRDASRGAVRVVTRDQLYVYKLLTLPGDEGNSSSDSTPVTYAARPSNGTAATPLLFIGNAGAPSIRDRTGGIGIFVIFWRAAGFLWPQILWSRYRIAESSAALRGG